MDFFRGLIYVLLLLLECICILGVDANSQIPLNEGEKIASRNVAIIGNYPRAQNPDSCTNIC